MADKDYTSTYREMEQYGIDFTKVTGSLFRLEDISQGSCFWHYFGNQAAAMGMSGALLKTIYDEDGVIDAECAYSSNNSRTILIAYLELLRDFPSFREEEFTFSGAARNRFKRRVPSKVVIADTYEELRGTPLDITQNL